MVLGVALVVALGVGVGESEPGRAKPSERTIPSEEELDRLAREAAYDARATEEYGSGDDLPEPTPERLKVGEKVFLTNCARCHGVTGRGDGEAGVGLNLPPTDLTDPSRYRYGHDAQSIYMTTAYGIDDADMAHGGGSFLFEERENLTLYVESLQK